MRKKIFTFLLALAASVGMSWATENSIVINGTPQVGDNSISLTYYFDPANVPGFDEGFAPTLKVKRVEDGIFDEEWLNSFDISSGTETITLDNLGSFQAGKSYDVCFAYNNGGWVDEVFQSFIPAEPQLAVANTLQLHVNDALMGSVAVTNLLGSGIVDNGDGTYDVPEGAEVTLQATPNEGYEFIGWKASSTICNFAECEFVDLHKDENPMTFDMYAEAAFMAEFAAVAPQPQPQPAGNVVTWDMSMDAVNGIVEQNQTKEVFGGITIAAGVKRAFMKNGNANALLFTFSNSQGLEGFKGFTFANTLGVNFKKIVLSGAAETFNGKESTGWVINDDKSTITWEGNAASVSIWETLNFIGPIPVNEVEFTLEGGEPAPQPAVEIGDQSNATVIEAFLTNNDGQTIDELIIDRPVLNNMYNTLCLPFDMNATQIAASSLNGVEIREFTGASVEGTTLNLSVGDPVNAVVAGRPYFVKFSAASQLDDLHFEDVTINNAILDNMAVTFDGVTFKGTFTPFVMPNGLNFQGGYLFLGQNNQLFWPSTDNPLKPFRAYFYVDVESSTPGNAPKYRGMPARIVEGKNVVTGIENANLKSEIKNQKFIKDGQLIIIKNDVRYNAQGQIVK